MATMTPELYELIIKIVDERVREIRVTREDFDKLTAAVNKLAEAQRRTEERLEQLAEAQRGTEESLKRLTVQVGRLSDTVGFGLEDVARVMAPGWFERHLDIAVEGELEPRYVRHGEAEVQVNLFGRGRRADGSEVLIVGEAKSRIHSGDVRSFAQVLRTVRDAYEGREILAFMFGYLIHPSADEEAQKHGILVLATYRR